MMIRTTLRTVAALAPLMIVLAVCAASCSASGGPGDEPGAGGIGRSGAGGAGDTGGGGGGAGGVGGDGGSAGGGATSGGGSDRGGTGGGFINTDGGQQDGPGLLGDGQACAGDAYGAVAMPLDIYVMMDRSGSMSSDNKWANVKAATEYFLTQSPDTDGMGVGISFFPADSGTEICPVSTFEIPKVEIAVLPGVKDAIIAAITQAQSGSAINTPTRAALEGAVTHAKTWFAAHKDHKVIVLLATDGNPTGVCAPNTVADVANIAASGLPDIKTYVVGVGSSLASLNQIASAGGSGQAFLVDTAGNAKQALIDALNTIRTKAMACEYAIPTPGGGKLDFDKVNVKFTPAGGPEEIIQCVGTKDNCDPVQGGWYYDDPLHPTKILMCDATCKKLEGFAVGKKLEILLGCQTVKRPPT